jgi:hypothetical protein
MAVGLPAAVVLVRFVLPMLYLLSKVGGLR